MFEMMSLKYQKSNALSQVGIEHLGPKEPV